MVQMMVRQPTSVSGWALLEQISRRRHRISFSWTITSRRSRRLSCGVAVAMTPYAQVLAVPDLVQRYRRRYHLCSSCCLRRGDFCILCRSTPLDQYHHGHIGCFSSRYRPRYREAPRTQTRQEDSPIFSAPRCTAWFSCSLFIRSSTLSSFISAALRFLVLRIRAI